MARVTVEITVNVYDEKAFRHEAWRRAAGDGLSREECDRYRDSDETTLAECAQMILDPGESPVGAEIVQSSAE
jgi:hypothetical protein